MREQKKQVLLPKLRFPEFRDAGEWEEKLLGAVCDMQAGKFVSASEILDKPAKEHYPCFGGNGLRGYTKSFNQSGRYSLIGRQGALCGNVNLVEGNFYATEHAVVTTPKLGIRTDWLFYNLCLLNLNRFATGQAQPGLSIDVLEKVNCAVPKDEKEQQKIADCLSSVDDLLTLETQKLDTLKVHKKGLMQQLFPAEGETLPKLRFPEFRDAGEWEKKKAGTLFANRIEEGEDGLPIYSVTMNDGMVKRSSLDRKIDDIGESSGNKKACKDDIAYNMMRMWQGAFGVSVEDCMVSPAYVVLAPENMVCSDFFGYLFKLPKYLLLLTSHSQGLTLDRLRLYYKDFAQISLLIPTFLEQQKIADCLSSIDELITVQTQKLAALKTHKKGLMQQLFPSVGGVDGEAGRGGRPVVDEAQG